MHSECQPGILGGVILGEADLFRFKSDGGMQELPVERGRSGSLARVLQLLIGEKGCAKEENGDPGFLMVLSVGGLCLGRWTGREVHLWQQVGKWCFERCGGACSHLGGF